MRAPLRPRSGCLLLCLCISVLTLMLQSFWVPLEMTTDEPTGRSREVQSHGFHSLALQLKDLNSRVNRLSRDRDGTRDDLGALLQSFRKDQQGLARLMERELKRVSQKIEQFNRHHQPPQDTALEQHKTHIGLSEHCEVPSDPTYPLCAEKMEFLQLHWKTDPCYSFYGVDGTTCSLLKYLSQTEDFAPLRRGTTSLPTMASETTSAHTEEGTAHSKAIISFDTVCNQMSVVLRPKSAPVSLHCTRASETAAVLV
uniref:alpha-1,6-mannosyl-glycoprotein 6-beta-N-acetylglucosaminyltransferase n=1 Tax=Neogobius melanostomus TaxID=47308 RepID=A0A8C6TAZ1_9GOBI